MVFSNPVEGLVKAGVEPVVASYLDNQVDEELMIGSVNSDHCTGDFACAEPGEHQLVTSHLGGLKFNGTAVRTTVRNGWL